MLFNQIPCYQRNIDDSQMSYRLFKYCKGNYTLDNTWIRIFVTRLLAVKKTYVFQLRVGKCNTANNKN